MCYRFIVINSQNFQIIQTLKYVREISQIIVWDALVIESYSFSTQMTHLNNALAKDKFEQFSFELKFQLQRLAQNDYFFSITIVSFMNVVTSHSHDVSAITTTRAIRKLLRQISFVELDTKTSNLNLQKLSNLLVQNQQVIARENSYSSTHVQRFEHICDIYKTKNWKEKSITLSIFIRKWIKWREWRFASCRKNYYTTEQIATSTSCVWKSRNFISTILSFRVYWRKLRTSRRLFWHLSKRDYTFIYDNHEKLYVTTYYSLFWLSFQLTSVEDLSRQHYFQKSFDVTYFVSTCSERASNSSCVIKLEIIDTKSINFSFDRNVINVVVSIESFENHDLTTKKTTIFVRRSFFWSSYRDDMIDSYHC